MIWSRYDPLRQVICVWGIRCQDKSLKKHECIGHERPSGSFRGNVHPDWESKGRGSKGPTTDGSEWPRSDSVFTETRIHFEPTPSSREAVRKGQEGQEQPYDERWIKEGLGNYQPSTRKTVVTSILQFKDYLKISGQPKLERKDLTSEIISAYAEYLQVKRKLVDSTHLIFHVNPWGITRRDVTPS